MKSKKAYEWDETKRRINLATHGVDFADARLLDWDYALFESQMVSGEVRFLSYAPIDRRVYAIVFTMRGTIIRIISFRKANKREVRNYVRNHT